MMVEVVKQEEHALIKRNQEGNQVPKPMSRKIFYAGKT